MILADQILAAIERNPDMGMLDVAEAVGHHIGEVRPILETLVDRHMILADYYGDPVERRYRRLPAKPKGLRWKGWKGLRYTVTNTAGERLGTVTATDEGEGRPQMGSGRTPSESLIADKKLSDNRRFRLTSCPGRRKKTARPPPKCRPGGEPCSREPWPDPAKKIYDYRRIRLTLRKGGGIIRAVATQKGVAE